MATPAFTLAGVDGFSKQWLSVLAPSDCGILRVEPFKSLTQLLESYPDLKVAAVDTPIGLPDEHIRRRKCDEEAKVCLGPRRSSIFYAPPRFLLEARSQQEASDLSGSKGSGGISAQAYGIFYYIRDADAIVQMQGQSIIKEVHPEVSFWRMNDRRALQYSKHKREGKEERWSLLLNHYEERLMEQCNAARYGTGAAIDDLDDALAALWSAQRILAGRAEKIPTKPQVDANGLLMEINY